MLPQQAPLEPRRGLALRPVQPPTSRRTGRRGMEQSRGPGHSPGTFHTFRAQIRRPGVPPLASREVLQETLPQQEALSCLGAFFVQSTACPPPEETGYPPPHVSGSEPSPFRPILCLLLCPRHSNCALEGTKESESTCQEQKCLEGYRTLFCARQSWGPHRGAKGREKLSFVFSVS